MTCYEMQQMVRAKLLDTVTVHKAGDCFWMTVGWGEWYSMKRQAPTAADRLEFLGKALAWQADNN